MLNTQKRLPIKRKRTNKRTPSQSLSVFTIVFSIIALTMIMPAAVGAIFVGDQMQGEYQSKFNKLHKERLNYIGVQKELVVLYKRLEIESDKLLTSYGILEKERDILKRNNGWCMRGYKTLLNK